MYIFIQIPFQKFELLFKNGIFYLKAISLAQNEKPLQIAHPIENINL